MKKLRLFIWPTLAIFINGCSNPAEITSSQFLAFGTLTEIQVATADTDKARSAIRLIEADFQKMHDDWHAWKTGPLTHTNDALAAGDSFTVPESVLELVRQSMPLAAASDNLFNPAIGRLIALWGFHGSDPADQRPPDPQAIEALVKLNPKLSGLKIEGDTITPENTSINLDFGAIGKGYGIDKTMQHLVELGIENAIINSGGDLKAMGSKNGKPWRIAVRHQSGQGILGYLDSQGSESYFTSGDYERKFIWQNRKYHHIIDPRTGYPAQGTRSVTVIHEQAVVADAAATALFVAGPGDWYRIARKMGIKYALLVDEAGRLHMNPKMRNRLQLSNDDHVIVLSESLE